MEVMLAEWWCEGCVWPDWKVGWRGFGEEGAEGCHMLRS